MSQSAKSQPEIIPFGAKALVVLVSSSLKRSYLTLVRTFLRDSLQAGGRPRTVSTEKYSGIILSGYKRLMSGAQHIQITIQIILYFYIKWIMKIKFIFQLGISHFIILRTFSSVSPRVILRPCCLIWKRFVMILTGRYNDQSGTQSRGGCCIIGSNQEKTINDKWGTTGTRLGVTMLETWHQMTVPVNQMKIKVTQKNRFRKFGAITVSAETR